MNQSFLDKIRTTIDQNNLFSIDNDEILIGVSGGADSMVLLDSLRQLGCKIAIAHCNFKLRGSESDGDQTFVEEYAQRYHIPIHICSFETETVAKEQKISIEMAARNLRYDWFEILCQLHGYTCIAIAHNQNDSIETFFINLLRSAGLRGLQGIPIRNGKVVRPLSDVTRKEIEAFAYEQHIVFRTDSSNLTNDYVRNKIRNIVLPELQQISPNCIHSITTSMNYLQSSFTLYQEHIALMKNVCCKETEKGLEINEQKILQQSESQTLLFEILHIYGFNSDTISQIYEVLNQQSGKTFESATHKAIHDRNTLYVVEKDDVFAEPELIATPYGSYNLAGKTISLSVAEKDTCPICKDKTVAMLDFDKISFPLIFRLWKQGDVFVPFGMKGKKKISDFLINEKIPLIEKQSVTVLESNGQIVWVVGMRISQDFAITKDTKQVLIVRLV
ncbi:MAG: tRNA lysidine(34) synthetase TilS [Bacteroidales bacterium]|nr:tRNA lysidine(34) synthetase TilS [Bacteroidales bacterium]